MTGKGKTYIAVLALVTVGACVIVSNIYFFNPLLFRKNEITYLPWSWYKKPLQIEYFVKDEEGWKLTKSTDTGEIRQFFKELQKGLHQSQEQVDQSGATSVWVMVRRVEDGVVLLALRGYEHGKQFTVQDNVPVHLSEKLQLLLRERLVDARSSTSVSK